MSDRFAPHVRMFQESTFTRLPVTAWESLTHALESGAEWWEGQTMYGESMMVRCRTITDVRYVTTASLQAAEDDNREEQFS